MKQFLTCGACVFAFAGLGFSQSFSDAARPIDGPILYGGMLHVASGTWTRNVPSSSALVGADIVYNNSANSEIFSDLNLAVEIESFEIIDEGRIPGMSSGVPGADRDFYTVNCIDVSYCVGDDTGLGALTVKVNLYNAYLPCGSAFDGTLAGGFVSAALPGTRAINVGTNMVSCWLVQFDLTGTEICLAAEGEGTYDAELDFDSFGIGYEFDPGGVGGYVGNVSAGPVLAGDRNWTAQAPGEALAAGLAGGGGGGTYYGPAETCLDPLNPQVLNSSGYDNQDFLYVGFGPSSSLAPVVIGFRDTTTL